MAKPPTVHTVESLYARCDEEGDCMLWKGSSANGVPQVYHDGKMVPVRKLVVQLRGGQVREGHYFSPKCDDQRCICEDHIVQRAPGLHQRLMAKRAGQGSIKTARLRKLTATRRATGAKLDEAKAREIRQSSESSYALAERFGVHRSLISRIKSGKQWRDYSNPFAGLMA